jgi:hypothetical protein
MYRAWNPDFYEMMKDSDPDTYNKMTYKQAFYYWKKEFKAEWESLLEEPLSEKVKIDELKLKSIIEIARTMFPICDGDNRARVVEWITDNISEMKNTFTSDLNLDYEAIADYEPPEPIKPFIEPRPNLQGL